MKLAAVSVDLDEIPCYAAIHGLDVPAGSEHAIYERAVPRLTSMFDDHAIPATFFAIGADLAHDVAARAVRDLSARGHEIASHSQRHLYDLTRQDRATIRREVEESLDTIERVVGVRPVGFRAPGYTITNDVLAVLRELGLVYDSSVFPCPAYYLPKATVIGALSVKAALGLGKASRSIVDDPRVLSAPASPYFPADRDGAYWSRGPREGLVEIPIGVTRGARLPFIGTSVALAGEAGARWLARQMVGREVVVLELHGIDLADAREDDLAWLAPHQPDLARTAEQKRRAIGAAIETLRAHGYRFVTTEEAARAVIERG
ncbi:MAG: polysaccharide deacetylase family protein [Deltaproteobacteria bacterium]|nr:polysaccharide deacetylase family protein [Deltaproteobacteria bacterium]